MDNSNIYTIKLNSQHLAKWMRNLFITIIVSYLFGITGNLLGRMAIPSIYAIAFTILQYLTNLVSAYCLIKLSQVEKIFFQSAIFFIILTFTNFITLFISDSTLLALSKSSLVLMMVIPAVIGIYSEYLEHKGFHNLLLGLEDSLAKRWRTLWYIYLVSSIMLLFFGVLSLNYINTDNYSGIESLLSGTLISSIVAIIHFVYKLIVLNKSTKFFQDLEI